MHLKATINRARTEIKVEPIVAHEMVGGSMYIYELVVDVNLYVGREALRAYFGADRETIADRELIFVETLNDGYTRYKCKIPNALYKKVKIFKQFELSLLLLDVGEDGEELDTILVAPPYFFTVQPNALNYEETMTPEEAEQFNSSLAAVVAKLNELSQQLPAKCHFGELVTEQGTVANAELAAEVKIYDLYYNANTCDLFRCTGKTETDTTWEFIGNNKGEKGEFALEYYKIYVGTGPPAINKHVRLDVEGMNRAPKSNDNTSFIYSYFDNGTSATKNYQCIARCIDPSGYEFVISEFVLLQGEKGEKGDKGDKGATYYSFTVQDGDLILQTHGEVLSDVSYGIDKFGNMILTLK